MPSHCVSNVCEMQPTSTPSATVYGRGRERARFGRNAVRIASPKPPSSASITSWVVEGDVDDLAALGVEAVGLSGVIICHPIQAPRLSTTSITPAADVTPP